MTDEELRAELAARNALVVHCSRTGKGDEGINGLIYPDDLRKAMSLCESGAVLSCSVIWPSHVKTFGPIGIVLKPRSTSSITSISPVDSGTSVNPETGKREGNGEPFSRTAVQATFANATDYNEWTVKGADVVGVFGHPTDNWDVSCLCKPSQVPGFDPKLVELIGDEPFVGAAPQTLKEIAAAFPGYPIYSFRKGELVRLEPVDAVNIWAKHEVG
jgi:hypothetical protein